MTSYFDIIMIPLQVMIVFFTITILSCLYSESCLEKKKRKLQRRRQPLLSLQQLIMKNE